MKKLAITLAAIGLGLLLTAPSFAFGPREGRGLGAGYGNPDCPRIGYGYSRGWNNLNLTDEQKLRIEALQLAHQKEVRPIREKMFDKSVELRRLWLETLHAGDMPAVGREQDFVGLLCRLADGIDVLLVALDDLVFHGEIVGGVHCAGLGLEIAHVAVGGQDLEILAEIFLQRFALGG
mgnify:CR=1 FL=1